MPFATALHQLAPLSEACQNALREHSRVINLKKGRFLLTPDQVGDKLYYLESGLVRIFRDTDTDTDTDTSREITCWFAQAGGFVYSVQSFLEQTPSKEYIETLEDCQLWEIRYGDLQRLLDEHPDLNRAFRLVYERSNVEQEKRYAILREVDHSKHYQMFLKLYPNLPGHASVKHIAQYIGTHHTNLSKIRKSLTKSHSNH